MLIKIGFEIALRFPIPTPVIYLLHVHPSRRPDLVEPEGLSTEPALPIEEYHDSFGNHRGRLYAPAGTLRLFSDTISVTAVHSMRTRQLRRSPIFLRSLPMLCSFYRRVDIARSTVSSWISLGVPFYKHAPDGNGFKRFATLSMDIFNSTISKLAPIVPHSPLLGSRSEVDAT